MGRVSSRYVWFYLLSCIFATPRRYYTSRLGAHSIVQSLVSAYGDNWHESLQLSNILGSGCIAQVYKGKIEHNGNERLVAIKVKHPYVDDDIDSDLDIMRLSVYILERIPFDAFRNLCWLNLPGFVKEMATMLSIQLDLRREAEHLNRFNNNFKNNDVILFLKVRSSFVYCLKSCAMLKDIIYLTVPARRGL